LPLIQPNKATKLTLKPTTNFSYYSRGEILKKASGTVTKRSKESHKINTNPTTNLSNNNEGKIYSNKQQEEPLKEARKSHQIKH